MDLLESGQGSLPIFSYSRKHGRDCGMRMYGSLTYHNLERINHMTITTWRVFLVALEAAIAAIAAVVGRKGR
jgi:hypothetical protein